MAKRRGNGEGSIYRKADGTWCATLTVGFDPNGKRKRRYRYGRTKAEVLEKLSNSRAESLSGLVVDPNQLRMADYLHRWLEDDARPTIRETTLLSYRSVVNAWARGLLVSAAVMSPAMYKIRRRVARG